MIKKSLSVLLIACTAGAATSCGNADERAAATLLAEARQAVTDGDPSRAATLLDSLNATFPAQTAVRREALSLMPEIELARSSRDLTRLDSLVAVQTLLIDSLSQGLRKIDNPVEPYFVARDEGSAPTDGLSARLSPDGMLYIIARSRSPFTAVRLTAPGGAQAATATVSPDGERNDLTGGFHTVHFIGEEADSLSRFAALHDGESLTVTWLGGNAPRTTALAPAQLQRIAAVQRYAAAVSTLRLLEVRRHEADARMSTARNQQARLAGDAPETDHLTSDK